MTFTFDVPEALGPLEAMEAVGPVARTSNGHSPINATITPAPYAFSTLLEEDRTPQVVAEVKQEMSSAVLVAIGCVLTVILTLVCL